MEKMENNVVCEDLKFKENALEGLVVVSQFSTRYGEQKLANVYPKTRKVNLVNRYRKQLERDGHSVKEVCEMILNDYDVWVLESSPIRHMTDEQKEALVVKMRGFNILAICIQDKIDSLSFLDSVDVFGEVTKDMKSLQDSILSFTKKTCNIVGVDANIELGDIADKVNELLDKE